MAKESFKDFVADQLNGLNGLFMKRMFGAYGLYVNEIFYGILDEGFTGLPQALQLKSRQAIDKFVLSYESRRFPKGLHIHNWGPFLSLSVTKKPRVFAYPISPEASGLFLLAIMKTRIDI